MHVDFCGNPPGSAAADALGYYGSAVYNASLAAFLIGAGEGHFFGFGFWDDIPSLGGQPDFSDHWDDMFRRRLGQPLGDGTYYPQTHSWLRAFASGTQVTSTWHAPRTETEAGRWEGVITFCETC